MRSGLGLAPFLLPALLACGGAVPPPAPLAWQTPAVAPPSPTGPAPSAAVAASIPKPTPPFFCVRIGPGFDGSKITLTANERTLLDGPVPSLRGGTGTYEACAARQEGSLAVRLDYRGVSTRTVLEAHSGIRCVAFDVRKGGPSAGICTVSDGPLRCIQFADGFDGGKVHATVDGVTILDRAVSAVNTTGLGAQVCISPRTAPFDLIIETKGRALATRVDPAASRCVVVTSTPLKVSTECRGYD